jgi:hypothetical protein
MPRATGVRSPRVRSAWIAARSAASAAGVTATGFMRAARNAIASGRPAAGTVVHQLV